MKSKKDAGGRLQNFTEYSGIPGVIFRGNSGEQTEQNTKFTKLIKKYRIGDITAEPYSPWKNIADKHMGKVKIKWRQIMVNWQVPKRLWGYVLLYEALIISRTEGKYGITRLEKVTGDTPDISE